MSQSAPENGKGESMEDMQRQFEELFLRPSPSSFFPPPVRAHHFVPPSSPEPADETGPDHPSTVADWDAVADFFRRRCCPGDMTSWRVRPRRPRVAFRQMARGVYFLYRDPACWFLAAE
jgi:hypothetical protein